MVKGVKSSSTLAPSDSASRHRARVRGGGPFLGNRPENTMRQPLSTFFFMRVIMAATVCVGSIFWATWGAIWWATWGATCTDCAAPGLRTRPRRDGNLLLLLPPPLTLLLLLLVAVASAEEDEEATVAEATVTVSSPAPAVTTVSVVAPVAVSPKYSA